jgi:hypothetical protein
MKLNEMYPSKYLKAADFAEDEVKTLTVRNVEMELMGQDNEQETKPVLFFREKDVKPFVCNRTNGQIIGSLYGDESDEWIGKRVYLYVTDVPSFGKMQPGIRVKAKIPPATAKPMTKPAQPSDEDLFEGAGDPPGTESMNLKAGGVATRQTA